MDNITWPSSSDYQDIGEVYEGTDYEWGQFPIYWGKCEFKSAISGRICFRIGVAVRCGGHISISNGESFDVTLSASAQGVGGSVSKGWTSNITTSRDIPECSSANPEICYPDSSLVTYDCVYETLITISWAQEIEFEPSSATSEVVWNIIPDPNCCPQEQSRAALGESRIQIPNEAIAARVYVPGQFTVRRPNELPTTEDIENISQGYIALFENMANRKKLRGAGCTDVGIATENGQVVWLSGPSAQRSPGTAAFLTGIHPADGRGGHLVMGENEILPIFAVAPLHVGTKALLIVILNTAEGTEKEIQRRPINAKTGTLNTWVEFIAPKQHSLRYGQTGKVILEVTDRDGCVRTLQQKFKVSRKSIQAPNKKNAADHKKRSG